MKQAAISEKNKLFYDEKSAFQGITRDELWNELSMSHTSNETYQEKQSNSLVYILNAV